MLNVLYLYDATQTYTNTVYEHISSLGKYSAHCSFFCHQDHTTEINFDLSGFDAICIHFTIRLPFDQISSSTAKALTEFSGLKFLFIQDEYDNTYRAWHWIKTLGIQLVFTVVPDAGIERIYPSSEFPDTRFISNLTGYVPDELNLKQDGVLPSLRPLVVGYRGRPLPVRYGRLGMEKIGIGQIVKSYCDKHGIRNDIAWNEESRIYGPRWYQFMASCRSMLGSESGSNVFDWDGTLVKRIAQIRKQNPRIRDDEVYERCVRAEEIDGIMNQVSPRIFEAIAAKTVLVLFEGNYSGVVKAGEHFIAVKKDGTNLADVVRLLQDGAYVDAMAERAHQDVIASGKYSYQSFVRFVDENVERTFNEMVRDKHRQYVNTEARGNVGPYGSITTFPIRAKPPRLPTDTLINTISGSEGLKDLSKRLVFYFWAKLPETVRNFLKPRISRLLGRD